MRSILSHIPFILCLAVLSSCVFTQRGIFKEDKLLKKAQQLYFRKVGVKNATPFLTIYDNTYNSEWNKDSVFRHLLVDSLPLPIDIEKHGIRKLFRIRKLLYIYRNLESIEFYFSNPHDSLNYYRVAYYEFIDLGGFYKAELSNKFNKIYRCNDVVYGYIEGRPYYIENALECRRDSVKITLIEKW